MGKLAAQVKATLEGVTSVQCTPELDYYFNVQCTSCRQDHPQPVTANRSDEIAMPGSRGVCNVSMKCRFCQQQMSITFTTEKGVSGTYTAMDSESQRFVTMAVAECRGLELTKWHLKEGFILSCESGTVFDNVDLSDEFADYDELSKQAVSVSEIETRIIKH